MATNFKPKKINSSSKKTKRKTSTQRKKPLKKRKSSPKIKLDRAKVNLFCSVIFLLCALTLSVTILLQPKTKSQKNNSVSQNQKTEITEKKIPVSFPGMTNKKARKSQNQNVEMPQNQNVEKTQNQNVEKSKNQKNIKESSSSKEKDSIKTKKSSQEKITNQKNQIAKTENKNLQEQKNASNNEQNPIQKTENKPSAEEISSSKTKPTENQKTQGSAFNIPKAKNGAKIVLILDDAGLSVENTKKYTDLPFPLTVAVLPKLSKTKECADLVRQSGKELILHQPMQSLNHNLNPGPGKISVEMSFQEIKDIVTENLHELGEDVKGINNHEGSEVTENVLKIGVVLDVCLENNIYFLDSRTTANSKAPQAALERDMMIFEKSGPYIDNVISRESMLKELYKTLDFANLNGKAIIIAHVDKSVKILPDLLKEMYSELKEAGYTFVTPSML